MRLTDYEQKTIRESFKQHFADNSQLWLFGSRVDDTKRGGDIDLYIETPEKDSSIAYNKRMAFAVDLQLKLGLQKIDIALNIVPLQQKNIIYGIAKETGIRLV